MADIELGQLCTNNYRDKKLRMVLASRDAEITALKSLLEETNRLAKEKEKELAELVLYWRCRAGVKKTPRKKPKPAAKQFGRKRTLSKGQPETVAA
jgi:hypothetical protein